VDLDQLAAVEQLDQARVGAGVQALPQICGRGRVQRLADLDVKVAVHLHPGEDRHVIGGGQAQQHARLLLGEHLGRASLDGAVDPLPGHIPAPRLGACLDVGKVGEVLAGEEVAAHILHHPLDPRFVLRTSNARCVGCDTNMLGVVQPPESETGIDRISVGDDRAHVVWDHHLEHPVEEPPGRLAPGDHRGQGLGEGQPHEHVPRVRRREDQRMDPAATPRRGIVQQPHLREVDLQLGAGLPIGDPHRRAAAAELAPLHAVPMQPPIRHHHTATFELVADLHHRQAIGDPAVDLVVFGLQHLPRRPVPALPDRPHRLDDLPHQLLGQLILTAVAGQPRRLRGLDIPAGGLAVHARPLCDLAQPGPRQPGP
jgi:hypothetical protein